MKKTLIAAAVVILSALSFVLPETASAAPTFARQTGMACNSCHFQHFPTLNAFGRAFKQGGYTMVGGQSLVEGDFLSLPSVLNASLITKVRYQKTNGDIDESGTNKGELKFPDEAALLIGGRAGEHIGFLLEAQLGEPTASAFASFKMPVVYKVAETDISVIPFKTDAAGASYGYEVLNTGAVRMIRPIEHRSEMSAQQYIQTDGAATGVSFVAAQSMWFANYTTWAHVDGTNDAGPYLHYLRAAVTPTVAGWDIGGGVQWWGGDTKHTAGTVREQANAWAIDAQAQGNAGNFPLGVYLSYGSAGKSKSAEFANIMNASTNKSRTAWAILGEIGVLPNRLTLTAGYRGGKNGDPSNNGKDNDTAATIGANYTLTQNVTFQWNTSWYSGDAYDPKPADGDQKTTLMLFAAF